jgi:glyoxylase-like metal-dependent hydrolase (beta-lactamase superfamily II)
MAPPRRQEQEPASAEVIEVAPGVLRCQLPIDMPGLGHVNCYILEDDRGVAVVDPGLPGRRTFTALTARLGTAGVPIRRVHTVVVTHSHPDHFGGAGWLRREAGAEIVTHCQFRLLWDPTEPPDVDVEDAAAARTARLPDRRRPWDRPVWGGDPYPFPFRRRMFMRGARRFPRLFRAPTPTVRVSDATTLRLAGREWTALHTPGHTDDHLCLFDPAERVMLSGDHVLPTITPHIGGFVRDADPLDRFFESLDKVAEYGPAVSTVLPAHGHPFDDLAGRAKAIRQHHLDRLDLLRRTSAELGRPARVQELSTHLFSARAQGPMADSETYAHLEHLRLAGELDRRESPSGFEYVLAG